MAVLSPEFIARALAAGRAEWPAVRLDERKFVDQLSACLGREAEPFFGADFYLACACAAGDGEALAILDRSLLSQLDGAIAAIDARHSFVDEVKQQLRQRLLVSDDGRPRILDYEGRGPLGGWLRVAAVRTALNLARTERRAVRVSPPEPALADPELDYIKTRYREDFLAALRETVAALPVDARNVLRLRYLDGVSVEEIASAYRVHRGTVARWLQSSRETLLSETQRRIIERLDLASGEADSMLRLVQSQIDTSVLDLL
jgi:RNA polymerase sigma-70 factor, ECF subfamily